MTEEEAKHELEAAYTSAAATYRVTVDTYDAAIDAAASAYRAAIDAADAAYRAALVAKRKQEARAALDATYADAHATYCVAIEDCCVVHAPRRRRLAYARTYRAALDAADEAYRAALVDKEKP